MGGGRWAWVEGGGEPALSLGEEGEDRRGTREVEGGDRKQGSGGEGSAM